MLIHQRLRSIPQLAKDAPALGETKLRELVRNAASNGLDEFGVIVRVPQKPGGKRAARPLIDIERFEAWWEAQRQTVAMGEKRPAPRNLPVRSGGRRGVQKS